TRRDGADLGDVVTALDRGGPGLEQLDDLVGRRLDTPAERRGVGPRGHVAQTDLHQRLRQHGGRRGAVAGHVVGLGGDVLGQLRAEVLERVFQLNFARYGDTVQGDRGATELLVQHDVSATRPEGYLDRVGELVHPALERPTSDLVE